MRVKVFLRFYSQNSNILLYTPYYSTMAMLLHHGKKLKYRIDVTHSGGLLTLQTKKETIFKVTTVKKKICRISKEINKRGENKKKTKKKKARVLEFHTCEQSVIIFSSSQVPRLARSLFPLDLRSSVAVDWYDGV